MILQEAWYENKKWVWILFPITLLFFCLSFLRRQLFNIGLLKSSKPKAFIIVVGNISVGGNGKTPTVIAIAEHLTAKGYSCGVLSRGYGGSRTQFPHLVDNLDEPQVVGDEPKLMQQRLSCPVVIDPKRVRGAEFLVSKQKCDVIICDDGLQHYALQRDFEVVVMDGRGVGNGYLLPMGPLRESTSRLDSVDAIVINGELPVNVNLHGKNSTAMNLVPDHWVNVSSGSRVDALPNESAIAIAGIGDPKRFFKTLETMGIKCKKTIAYPDHHTFLNSDIPPGMVLMTEKDAVKCRQIAHDNCWYLQVSGNISGDLYQLIDKALDKVS